MKIKKVLSARKALLCAAIASSSVVANASSVAFYEIPLPTPATSKLLANPDVANNGTVVGRIDNSVYSWSPSQSLNQVATAATIYDRAAAWLSDEGDVITVAGSPNTIFGETNDSAQQGYWVKSGANVTYADDASFAIPSYVVNFGNFPARNASTFLGKSSNDLPASYDAYTATLTEYSPAIDADLASVRLVNQTPDGNTKVFAEGRSEGWAFWTEYYVQKADGSLVSAPFNSTSTNPFVMDESGSKALYSPLPFENSCQEATDSYGRCGKVWDINTNTSTEIGGFIPRSMSADGSVIVGSTSASGTVEAELKIWDAINGERDLVQLLAAKGIDVSDWYFHFYNSIQVSADGTKILVTGDNPQGIPSAFLVDITPVCTVF